MAIVPHLQYASGPLSKNQKCVYRKTKSNKFACDDSESNLEA